MLKTSTLISQTIQLLDPKQASWGKLKLQIEEDTTPAAKKIKLDVGGRIFCIGKSHLLCVESSYFHAMLSSGHWKPDTGGANFIDRNPKHFDRILDCLRTGDLSFAGLRPDQIETLKKTLDYLQLGGDNPEPELVPVTWDLQMCGSGFWLSQENGVIVYSLSGCQTARSLNPCVRYSVRIDFDQRHPNFMSHKMGLRPIPIRI